MIEEPNSKYTNVDSSQEIDSNIQDENKDKLIHEHNFVQLGAKQANHVILCITCKSYFCRICGRSLNGNNMKHFGDDLRKSDLGSK